MICSEDEGRDHKQRNGGSNKRQQQKSLPQSPQKECSPACAFWTPDPQNRKIMNLCSFKPLSLQMICYNTVSTHKNYAHQGIISNLYGKEAFPQSIQNSILLWLREAWRTCGMLCNVRIQRLEDHRALYPKSGNSISGCKNSSELSRVTFLTAASTMGAMQSCKSTPEHT